MTTDEHAGHPIDERPADPGTGYFSEQDRAIVQLERDGTTAYRFVAPGILLGGVVDVTVRGDWWHAEQEIPGDGTIAVDAEGELEVILALIAKQQGLAAVFGPADLDEKPPEPRELSERRDPVYSMIFNAVSQGTASAGRFLPLSARDAITSAVYQDLRAAGVIK